MGSPNVGKSVIFNYLTGGRVQVANYPGTTVEVARGKMIWAGVSLEIVDTPGIYSLLPITAEEQVTRRLLWTEKPALTVHVVDAKNLERIGDEAARIAVANCRAALDQASALEEIVLAAFDQRMKSLLDEALAAA